MRRLILVAAVLLPLASPAFAVSTCEKYGTISVMSGQYIVQNDVWGASTAQCIDVPNTSQAAFTVASSSHNQGSVASYPSIYKGCHYGVCTSGSGLPMVYSNVSSAPFSWSVTRASSGTWNIAAEAWLSPSTNSSNGYSGGAEIMIWLDYNGSIQPAGSQVGTANIAGASWQVWYSNIGWNYVAYRRVGAASSISADLKAFIDDSVSRGYVQRSWYLHDLEAGSELMVGGAGFRTNSFSFSVNGGGGGTTFGLSVTRSGSGTGTVTSNPSGINCGSTCSANYNSGTTVTLSAAPASGSTFAGWSGACTGTGTCTVSMTAGRSVTATFNTSGGGGGTCTTVSGGQSGNFNTTAAVCYTVNSTINGWGCSNTAGRTVTVNNTAVSCGQMPLPGSAPYTFRFTAGSYPWASFYWW
jgi:hypothetical protein